MREIRKIAVLGASGNMGSLSGGLFAQNNVSCVYFARSIDKAQAGIENAVNQARSSVLRKYIRPASYDQLEAELKDCDWIFEGLGEDISLKKEFFAQVDRFRKPGSIVSTVSSGLSIEEMVSGCSEDMQSHFMGTHFYNPPGKLPANELIFHPKNSPELRKFVRDYCEQELRRVNIVALDVPAFAGNRIGFQFLNEAAIYAEKHGVTRIDYLLGPYTGRAMAPLATIDLVGLDVHKAIVDNVYSKLSDERHDTYKMPAYMQRMIDNGQLGRKSGKKGGFFNRDENKNKLILDPATLAFHPEEKVKVAWVEKAKEAIHNGRYQAAIELIRTSTGEEAEIVRHFILGYVSYSFFRVGEATPVEDSIHGIDRVMSSGFSWLPPSGWVDLLGGPGATVKLLQEARLPVPEALATLPEKKICKVADITKFLNGR